MSSNLLDRYSELRGKREHIKTNLDALREDIKKAKAHHNRVLKAREVIRAVALVTQEQLSFHIQDIVTLALDAVFPNPYKFKVSFVENRNRTECVLSLIDSEGNEVDAMEACGGGVVDVASFALRVASWSMMSPGTKPVLILDEPFRYLSRDLLGKAGEMLHQVSEKLGLQIIMITHEDPLVDAADRVFVVDKSENDQSSVF